MRYSLCCSDCVGQTKDNSQFTVNVTPNNKGVYNVVCPNGHNFDVDILSHHFQVLFENGIHSLSDGYYIEAFVSFVASYERFIEYFLNIVFKSNVIDESEFSATWKELAKQSERQIGAFYLIYLNEFKVKPSQLSNKNKELRNNVIHKGQLPTKEDCVKFGDDILNFIRQVVQLLKNEKKYDNALISSVNLTGNSEDKNITRHFIPYQVFAINRPINDSENKKILDFLEEQKIVQARP